MYRGLRKILKVPSTFIDRRYTNQWLLDKANEECTYRGNKKPAPISTMIKNRQDTLLGHIIRAGSRNVHDPLFVVTFSDYATLKQLRTITKRVGRPKLKWVDETMRRAWDKVKFDATPCSASVWQHNTIKIFAIRYFPPFHTKENRGDTRNANRRRFSWQRNEVADRARMRNR